MFVVNLTIKMSQKKLMNFSLTNPVIPLCRYCKIDIITVCYYCIIGPGFS